MPDELTALIDEFRDYKMTHDELLKRGIRIAQQHRGRRILGISPNLQSFPASVSIRNLIDGVMARRFMSSTIRDCPMEEPTSRLTVLLARTEELAIQVGGLTEGPRKRKLLSELAGIRVQLGTEGLVQEQSLAASLLPADTAPAADSYKVGHALSA